MPCATVHLLLAGRALARWRDDPGHAPFDPARPGAAEAFLHGALAPDMGFIPGVDRTVSELAHYVRPLDLTRSLLAAAGDEDGRAFAWGWAAHVLGDVEVHPLVGRTVGEHHTGDRSHRMDALEDEPTHVAYEVGLDAVILRRDPAVPPPPDRPFLDGRRAAVVADAYREAYGWAPPPAELVRSHRIAVARTARWPALLSLLAAGRGLASVPWGPVRTGLARAAVVGVAAVVPETGAVGGLVRARRPPAWLLEGVAQAAAAFPEKLQAWADRELQGVPNLNLETGAVTAPEEHAATRRALARLGADRNRSVGRG